VDELDLWEFVDFFFFIFFIDFIKNISQKNISQLMSSIYPKHSNHHLLHIKPWIFLRFSGQKWQKSPRKPSKMAVLAPRSDCCAGKGRPGQDDPGTVCDIFFIEFILVFQLRTLKNNMQTLFYNLRTLFTICQLFCHCLFIKIATRIHIFFNRQTLFVFIIFKPQI
jgi:hypothetical protein